MIQNQRPSRRDFLKGSTAVVAGAALVGGLSIARSAHAAGGDQIKVALIGCGGRGTGAGGDLLSVPDNVKLVAVADAFADQAQKAAERLKKEHGQQVDIPPERIFSGFDGYRKAIDCGVDMVILATPPGFRPMHYKAAIEAGKHVFMEKPVCVDAPGFRSVMETNKLADQKGLKVGVGLQRHHQPTYQETVKRIRDGALGKILFLRAYWNGGAIWIRRRKPEQTEMEYQMRNWYHFVWLSGDNIVEQHVHNLDVCNWIVGDHPVEANGMGGCQVRYSGENKGVGQIYDHHFVEFTYADGTKMFSQCRQINGCWNSVAEAAHGTQGESNCSSWINAGGKEWKFQGDGAGTAQGKGKGKAKGKAKAKAEEGGVNPYVQEHVDLLAAIRKNEKYNEGYVGAASTFTAVLGRMATYSGQVVKWDDAVANGRSEMPEKFAWDAKPPAVPNAQGDYPIPTPGVYKAY